MWKEKQRRCDPSKREESNSRTPGAGTVDETLVTENPQKKRASLMFLDHQRWAPELQKSCLEQSRSHLTWLPLAPKRLVN